MVRHAESIEDAYARGRAEGYAAALRESRRAQWAHQQQKRAIAAAEVAHIVTQARALAEQLPPDPDAARHRQEISTW